MSFEVILHSIFEATHGRIFQANHAVPRETKLKGKKKVSSTHKTVLKQHFEMYGVSISKNATPTEGHTSHPGKWCNCSKVQDVAVSLLPPNSASLLRHLTDVLGAYF